MATASTALQSGQGEQNKSVGSPSPIQAIRGVPWRIRDAVVVFVLPWVALPLILVILLSLLAPTLPAISHYLHALLQGDTSATFGLVLVDAVGSFTAIGYFLRRYHVGARELGLRGFSPLRAALYVALILLTFSFLVLAAYWVVQLVDPRFNAMQPQTNSFIGHPSPLSLLAVVIIPPLVEEPTFRGFIFPAFARRYGVVVGMLVTSVLFGLAHLQGNVSVYTFILSLLLCWLYTRVGSIIPGIGLHMLNNYIAYIAMNQK